MFTSKCSFKDTEFSHIVPLPLQTIDKNIEKNMFLLHKMTFTMKCYDHIIISDDICLVNMI